MDDVSDRSIAALELSTASPVEVVRVLDVGAKDGMLLEGSNVADREVIGCMVDEDGCLKSLEVASSNSSRFNLDDLLVYAATWSYRLWGMREETYRSRRPSGPAAEASDNKRMLRKKAEVRIMKILFEFGRKRRKV